MNKILSSEPVRAMLYPLLLGLVAVLVTKGIVSAELSPYIVAAVAAALGIPAVEVARSKVYSQATIDKR